MIPPANAEELFYVKENWSTRLGLKERVSMKAGAVHFWTMAPPLFVDPSSLKEDAAPRLPTAISTHPVSLG